MILAMSILFADDSVRLLVELPLSHPAASASKANPHKSPATWRFVVIHLPFSRLSVGSTFVGESYSVEPSGSWRWPKSWTNAVLQLLCGSTTSANRTGLPTHRPSWILCLGEFTEYTETAAKGFYRLQHPLDSRPRRAIAPSPYRENHK